MAGSQSDTAPMGPIAHTCYPALVTFLRVSCEDPHTGGRRTFGPYAQLGGTRRPLANSAVHRVAKCNQLVDSMSRARN
jgi:hypothetical protein